MTLGCLRVICALLPAVLWTGAAAAQVELGGDVTAASTYVWRGLTVVNRPVLQPSAWLTAPLGPLSVTGSVWSNVEIGEYDDRSDISESGGTSSWNLAELDPSLELGLPLGEHALALGVDGFLYTNGSGYTHDDDAAEVFLRLDLAWPGAPSLGFWHDVSHVDGTYAELALSHSFALGETSSLDLSGSVGWSLSQAEDLHADGTVRRPGNFQNDGLTHFEAGVGLSLLWGRLTVQPWLRAVAGADPSVEVASGTGSHDVKVWGGISISGARALGEGGE
jgi:hypothetical protein